MNNPPSGQNLRAVVDKTRTEADIRAKLKCEPSMARRQELLKTLWKLTQQPSEGAVKHFRRECDLVL